MDTKFKLEQQVVYLPELVAALNGEGELPAIEEVICMELTRSPLEFREVIYHTNITRRAHAKQDLLALDDVHRYIALYIEARLALAQHTFESQKTAYKERRGYAHGHYPGRGLTDVSSLYAIP